ncbi:RnfH family protein [Paenalcaligenes hominis]|uniref:RnfH family protein n=1 Tax=Paenalcaligenes hominis TaxID=643674 RepID=UPI003525A05B
MITIEIVFAAKNTLWQRTLSVPAHSTAQYALQSSGLYEEHPEAVDLAIGLFGELCQAQTELRNGDRLEVYRDLVFDPMESRRRRAAHRSQQQAQTKTRRKPSIAASMILNRD